MIPIQRMAIALLLGMAAPLSQARAQTPCGGSAGPDVIVGRLNSVWNWGSVGDIAAFSVGTTSCNMGNAQLLWDAAQNTHPVIGQNMYRLKAGRFEQIGMSWLKHGFLALAQNECCTCQNPGTGSRLGVGCSDPYSASLNGAQGSSGTGGLGPRFQVNANTGFFNFPYAFQGDTGDAIFKRLQVHHADLDPALNTGASYFVDGHYVTPDDAAAGNQDNNASYQPINVSPNGASYVIALTGVTQREMPGIQAWQDHDLTVTLEPFDDPDGGHFILGYSTSDNGDGTTRYEYALYNMNSHLSAQRFSVPVPSGVTVSNIGFHDVDYHSGEPYVGADWAIDTSGQAVTWSSQTFAENPNANALRWGTLYNFRFDADTTPVEANATVGLYRTWDPDFVEVAAMGPSEKSITVAQGETVVILPGQSTCDPATECAPLVDELLMVTNSCVQTGTLFAEVFEQDLHPDALRFRSVGRTLVIDTDLPTGCLDATVTMPFSLSDVQAPENALNIVLAWFDGGRWVYAVCGNTIPAPNCPIPNLTSVVEIDPDPQPTLADLHARPLGTHGVYWNGTQGFSWARIDHASDFTVALPLGSIPAVSAWGALALGLAILAVGGLILRSRRLGPSIRQA